MVECSDEVRARKASDRAEIRANFLGLIVSLALIGAGMTADRLPRGA